MLSIVPVVTVAISHGATSCTRISQSCTHAACTARVSAIAIATAFTSRMNGRVFIGKRHLDLDLDQPQTDGK